MPSPLVFLALALALACGTGLAQPWVFVPANGQPVSLLGLQVGATYQLRISGWMGFGTWASNGRALLNDACYEFNAKGVADPLPVVQNELGVSVCGPYRADHVYASAPFVAPTVEMRLWVYDTDYRDNQGGVLAEALLVAPATADGYCILRRPDAFGDPNCFEFYLADTARTTGALATLDARGACVATPFALRQGWSIDPILGGPYGRWEAADSAMTQLSRYGGDQYGCLVGSGFGTDDDAWANTCPWAFDGECDEPGIGTGLCSAGTDTADCRGGHGFADTCRWAFDGECDEPGIGTGLCAAGTDTSDCASIARAPGGADPEADLPPDAERRDQTLNQCDVWSATNAGGVEGTVDAWDVATIPAGATFDLRFDAHSVPDRFRVVYEGAIVFESGWRGDASYADAASYPGGIAGPGAGEALGLFARAGTSSFTVIVIGVDPDTEWDYSVRCRMP